MAKVTNKAYADTYTSKYRFVAEEYAPHIKIIKYVGKDKRVLDVGCATGYLAEKLAENDNEVYGIEVDPKAAEGAKKLCKDVIAADIENLGKLP